MRHCFVATVLLMVTPAVCLAQLISPDRGPHVSVTGAGIVEADPDMATVALGVYVLDRDLPRGKAAADAAVSRLLQLTESLGIKRADVASASIAIEPQYSEADQRDFVGYEISRSVEVTLRDLLVLDRLIDQGIQAGANREFRITLSSSRERELRQKALALAVENAKEQAERLAVGFGATLGPVRSIDTGDRYNGSARYSVSMVRVGAGTFQPGTLRYEAQVSVSFTLKGQQ